ncbi:MAG: hypothetical protein GYA57_06550 [Myxococcales bacterium]|nr:hypothetical protein [Myxococcales bacterium]
MTSTTTRSCGPRCGCAAVFVAAATLALGAVGCGGGDDSGSAFGACASTTRSTLVPRYPHWICYNNFSAADCDDMQGLDGVNYAFHPDTTCQALGYTQSCAGILIAPSDPCWD